MDGSNRNLRPLPEAFYHEDTVTVARQLLGTHLVHDSDLGRTIGRIVETEAYLGFNDPASHAFGGRTVRNAVMFDEPGKAYIYFIYGRYYCLNVTTMPAGIGEAVLVRALEPVEGIPLMRQRRGFGSGTDDRPDGKIEGLCNGPGKLVLAMDITPKLSGHDLRRPPLMLMSDPDEAPPPVAVTRRIGITKAAERPLRFHVAGSRFVSGAKGSRQRSRLPGSARRMKRPSDRCRVRPVSERAEGPRDIARAVHWDRSGRSARSLELPRSVRTSAPSAALGQGVPGTSFRRALP